MLEDRIRTIEARVQSSTALGEADRAELLEVIASLRTELAAVEKEHLHEAESSGPAPYHGDSLEEAVGGLTGAVTALEATHPQLAALANRLALALSNMGI
jgi:hypothetical protein